MKIEQQMQEGFIEVYDVSKLIKEESEEELKKLKLKNSFRYYSTCRCKSIIKVLRWW